MPQLWIVAGPNGAGKTTIAERWLASRIPVISPDTLAAIHNLSPIQAGKAAIQEQERLLSSGASFAVDTTFSGNRELELMKRAKAREYKVNLIFICVSSSALCQARIEERISSGGHAVPAKDVARRFERSLENLKAAFDISERVFVLDNTGESHRLILSVERGRLKHFSRNTPDWAKQAIPERFIRSRGLGFG
ncbi:MAG: AAA family ATPase [Nitrospirota bacterium]|nr:AAA family ATPase [Nitrospirota bacterium]